jgi:pimeloyl-ACP methyl ester carboxylesterase
MTENTAMFVEVNNKSINYRIINQEYLSAEKPVLVFLHEGLGCSEQWKNFPEQMSSELNLAAFVYDRYGYGKSQKIAEPREIDYLEKEASDYMPELFRKTGLDNYKKIIFGHSDGGSIAIVYASLFPNDTLAIITEAAHVFIDEITEKGLQEAHHLYYNTDFREKLRKYHGSNTETMAEAWLSLWLRPEMLNWNIEHYITGITCPVLAIQGTDDNFGNYSQLESRHSKSLGKSEILYIQNCGHIPHHQARDTVMKKSIEFAGKFI